MMSEAPDDRSHDDRPRDDGDRNGGPRDKGTHRISIRYCTQCNWLLRSAWMAQELLSTFGTDLAEVALCPDTGGRFEIRVDDVLIWERARDGGFPGPRELKRLVRDIIAPERNLGHVDR